MISNTQYCPFDSTAIGDSYVAVCGLPNPNQKHFLTVSRFAWKCLGRFGELTKRMEARLGPDTADLGLRLGLHRYVQQCPFAQTMPHLKL